MSSQKQRDYARIEKAIHFIHANFRSQPSLEEIAKAVHMSPYHFQRMFREWAGVSPKKFMQYISLEYAKGLLEKRKTVLETTYETGFSGASRLHDLFVTIEGMTPGEFQNGGASLTIRYRFAPTPFGKILAASTGRGVCHMAFEEDEGKAVVEMKARFPNATYRADGETLQQEALRIFQKDWQQLDQIKLHLAGTPFQVKVWESLLKIPLGERATYAEIARQIGSPKACRAVGTAIGSNPVAYLIPCHRVIQASGKVGGYMWGPEKKTAILGWEAAQIQAEDPEIPSIL